MRCYEKGRRFYASSFVLFVKRRDGDTVSWRMGMAVTRKTGSAVWRNRVRRLIRECFRLEQAVIAPGYDYVVVPKRGVDVRALALEDVRMQLLPLLRRVGRGEQKLVSG